MHSMPPNNKVSVEKKTKATNAATRKNGSVHALSQTCASHAMSVIAKGLQMSAPAVSRLSQSSSKQSRRY